MNMAPEELPEPEGSAPVRVRTVMQPPTRDQVTAIQVNTLLHAAQGLNHLLYVPKDEETPGGRNDGGIAIAVETSIIKICERVDAIVDDATRWDLAPQQQLEQQLSKIYSAHLNVLETQKEVVLFMKAPHRSAMPQLVRLEDGNWAAILGNVADWDNCIVGVGDCAAAALQNFDEVFNGRQTNEYKLDRGGIAPADDTPGSGENLSTDSEETPPN